MKVFLSVPFRDRTDDEILASFEKLKEYFYKNRDTLEIPESEPIEFINNFQKYEKSNHYKHPKLYCLSKALEKLADCDMLVGYTPDFDEYGLPTNPGCLIESLAASFYNHGVMVFDPEEEEADE